MKESTSKRYRVLEHTADLALRIYGRSLKDLFSNAAFALFDVVTDLSTVEERAERAISLRARDLERLMVKWLNELLYHYEVENLLFKRFEVKRLERDELEAVAYGEVFREGVHVIFTNPKAVTHHKIEIAEGLKGWEAKIIIDL